MSTTDAALATERELTAILWHIHESGVPTGRWDAARGELEEKINATLRETARRDANHTTPETCAGDDTLAMVKALRSEAEGACEAEIVRNADWGALERTVLSKRTISRLEKAIAAHKAAAAAVRESY